MQEQAKQELNRRGLWGYVEPVLTMGSAAFAEPVSGLVGLAALPYGSEASNRAIANTQEAMTYQPRTEDGQQGLQDAAEFMQPVGDAFIGASEYLGDAAYNATGSPALGAAAYSVPTMALEALGLKGARYASKGRAAYEMGDIGTQASKYGGKQRGIFAGVKAKGADLKQMEAAQELANRGVSRDEIWAKTGWFEDVDGKWKFEIDDSGAEFLLNDDSPLTAGIDEAIKHDYLMAGYPDANKGIVRRRAGDGGSYSTTEGISGEQVDFIKLGMDESPVNQKSTLLHELQHAIQAREGFASGGNPDRLSLPKEDQFKYAKKAYEAGSKDGALLADLGIDLDLPRQRKAWDELTDRQKLSYLEGGREMAYMRLAGEAEARNVQTRLDYTPEQRRATPPWKTLDVPEDELIVRRGNGVAMSITPQDALKELEARGVPRGSYLDENWQSRMLTKERFDELGLGSANFGTTRADLTKAHPDGISYLGGAKFDTAVPAEGGPAYSDMFGLGWAVKKPSAAKGLTRDDYLIPTAMFPDSHKSNATVSTVYTKALDEHINNGWISDRTIAEMELDLAKQFPDVPQGGNPQEFDKWLRGVSFDKRAAVMTTLNKAKFEGKGLPDINRLLNHTIDSGAAGREAGEAMTLIANSPDKTPVKLGSEGYPAHLSYDYGTKGKVEAVMPPALMEADLFPEKYNQYFDSFKERGRPNPKADTHYTFRIGSHGNRFGESIRELLPSRADIEGKRQVNTKSFKAALATLNDDWTVIQQGSAKGVKEFLRSMEANEGGATLTQLNAKGLAADIRQGKAKIFQLGSGSRSQDMKFMIKRDSYRWADESLPEDEWVLSSVLNNEVGVKGVAAEAILHKAMKEGVTALDAFDVKGAYGLPQIYSKYGFEEAARLPFDKEMFLGDARQFYIDQNLGNNKRVSPRLKKEADAAANQRLADAENFWRSQGWDESQGYPDVVIMRQDYNEANIAATDKLYKRAAQRARDTASGRAIGSGSAQSSEAQRRIAHGVLDSIEPPQGGRGSSNSAFSDSDSVLPSGRRSGVIDTVESGLAYPTLRRTLE